MQKTFDHLILIGRPAGGKSEFIDYVKGTDVASRTGELHIGEIEEIDDFPWIYDKFKEDNLWEAAGHPRLYSKPVSLKVYNTTDFRLYDFMIGKFNVEIKKRYLSNPSFYEKKTLFVEFARGMKDAYKRAFSLFDKEVLARSAILNIFVSYEESLRRNNARCTKRRDQNVLYHVVPESIMKGYYHENDWLELTGNKGSGSLEIKGIKVPFITMNNEPELPAGPEIVKRYKTALDKLFELYSSPFGKGG